MVNMKILFRPSLAEEGEVAIAEKYFKIVKSRCDTFPGDLVIGRYSVLPYYKELEDDLGQRGAHLINTYRMHQYIADIETWYPDLKEFTPQTWFRVADVPMDEPGSFVLKGATNSRKALWKTHMFAQTRADVMTVYLRLLDDSLIGGQGICVRKYEPLKQFEGVEGVQGLPVTNEWRYFFLDGQELAHGFYWSEHEDQVKLTSQMVPPEAFVQRVVNKVKDRARFLVIDFGQRADGSWMVVELNDGQMSGTSSVPLDTLYRNLKNVLGSPKT